MSNLTASQSLPRSVLTEIFSKRLHPLDIVASGRTQIHNPATRKLIQIFKQKLKEIVNSCLEKYLHTGPSFGTYCSTSHLVSSIAFELNLSSNTTSFRHSLWAPSTKVWALVHAPAPFCEYSKQ